jgi:hypothetical protein
VRGLGPGLGGLAEQTVGGRLLVGVLPIPPGQAVSDHREVRIQVPEGDLADGALVSVGFVPLHLDDLAADQIGKLLLRAGAECLSPLRRIDPGQADAPRGLVHQHIDGVSIDDGSHSAGEGLGVGLGEKHEA